MDKEKKQILSSLSTANIYRLSRVKVSRICVQPFQRYWGFGVFGGFRMFLGCFRVLGCLVFFGVWGFWVFWGVRGFVGVLLCFWGV